MRVVAPVLGDQVAREGVVELDGPGVVLVVDRAKRPAASIDLLDGDLVWLRDDPEVGNVL